LYAGPANSIHTLRWATTFKSKGHQTAVASKREHTEFIIKNEVYPPSIHVYPLREIRSTYLPKFAIRHPRILLKGFMASDFSFSHLFNHLGCSILGKNIKEVIDKFEADILHAHYALTYGTYALFAEHHPYVISTWGSDLVGGHSTNSYQPRSSKSEKIPTITKRALKNADLVHVETNRQAEIVKNSSAHPDRIIVQNWGVNLSLFNENIDCSEVREKYDIGEKDRVVVSMRTLDPIYSIDTIIKSVPLLLKEMKNVKVIVGADGPLRYDLIRLASELGVQKTTVFTGFLSREELAKVFAISDVYVQCPLGDGVSYTMLEAMACGVPVVTTNVGDTSVNIKEGYNGFFFQEKDPHELARTVLRLLKDDDLREGMKNNAIKWVKQNCDERKAMETIEKRYKEVV